MKKITFMMSLLLAMGSMTASAQVLDRTGWKITTSGECDDSGTGHASAIIDGNNNTYWHSNWGGGNGSGDNTSTLPQFFQIDLGSEQEFNTLAYMPRSGLSNGTVQNYKVYVSNTPFEKTGNGKSAADIVNGLTDAAAIESSFSYSEGTTATLQTYKHTSMLKGRYVLFVVTGAKSDQADKGKYFASCAEFYLSKDADIVAKNITYHYMVNGEEYASTTLNTIDDGRIPNMPFLTNGEKTAVADGYNIACTEKTLPFTATSTFDANTAHWYAMTMRGNSGNYLLSAKGGEAIGTTTIDKTNHPDVLEDKYQWAFVGNLKDGYKIYSKSENKPIVLDGQLKLVDGKESTFKLYETSNNDGFGLFVTEGNCLNRHEEDIIDTWDGFDDGSTIRLQEPKSYVIDYAAPFSLYDDSGAPEGAIGANSYLADATNLAKFKEVYEAAIANNATAEQIKALAEENMKIDAGKGETIVAGKYYRLVNAASLNTLYVTADNIMQTSKEVNKAVSSVVTFTNAETGRYRIKMQDKTFGKRKGNNIAITLENEDSGEKGSYKVIQVGTHFAFYDMVSNVSDRSYLHCNATAANTLFTWDAGAINSPSHWYVVPATDVEIAMAEANSKRYASAYLPFSVSAVDGAQAYVGELNDAKNVLNMTAVNGVPANNGFVLVGNKEKATLTIGNAEPLTITNALTGSNVKVALETTTGSGESATVTDHRAEYLVFGTNAGNVGFYKPSATNNTIAANKAFIAASSLTTGEGAIAMNFGGNITGIDNAVVASENAPIFDLSGRRVVKAVKGGVYIQNGKKFVK